MIRNINKVTIVAFAIGGIVGGLIGYVAYYIEHQVPRGSGVLRISPKEIKSIQELQLGEELRKAFQQGLGN